MTTQSVTPSLIDGRVTAPPSKSYEQRYLAAALLSGNVAHLRGFSTSNDTTSALDVITRLGCNITRGTEPGEYTVRGTGGVIGGGSSISIGESGLATRLFTPIAALGARPTIITGHGSILTRPMDFMKRPLETLGARVQFTNDRFLPIGVSGPLVGCGEGRRCKIDGAVGSQFLSGLLFALPVAAENSLLEVENLTSRPYIDMTIAVLAQFGIRIRNENYEHFHITGNQHYTAPDEIIPGGDWSSASCLLVAGAVAGSIEVQNLAVDPCQADAALLTALREAGAKVEIRPNAIHVAKPATGLRGFTFDATQCPDLFPALAVLAAATRPGEYSEIRGTSRLTHKESDRGSTIAEEFAKAGVQVDISTPNIMKIGGGSTIKAAQFSSHNDHRIAMAAAILSLLADGAGTISQPEAVNKSYPAFWDDFSKILRQQ